MTDLLETNIPVFQDMQKTKGADNFALADELSKYFSEKKIPWKLSPAGFSGQIYFIPDESLTPKTIDGNQKYNVSLVSVDKSPFIGIETDLKNRDAELYKTLIVLGYEPKGMEISRAGLALPVKKFGDVLPQLEKLAEILYRK